MSIFWRVFERIERWLFGAFAAGAWITRHGGDIWHVALGLGALCVVVLRIVRGFRGAIDERFAAVVRAPRDVLGYLNALYRRTAAAYSGHTPLSGWTLVAILVACVFTVLTGWFMTTDGLWSANWLGIAHYVWGTALLVLSFLHAVVSVARSNRSKRS